MVGVMVGAVIYMVAVTWRDGKDAREAEKVVRKWEREERKSRGKDGHSH